MNFKHLVERLLREAQERGDFTRLPRMGRIELDDDALVPEDERLAVHVLKSNDMAPAWIEEDKALRERLAQGRAALRHAWERYQHALQHAQTYTERSRAEQDWQRAKQQFESLVEELNRDIFHFNLRAPSHLVQRLPLRLSEEYARICGS